MPRHTLVHQLADWAERRADVPAVFDGTGANKRSYTWRAFNDEVRAVAKGLMSLGHAVGECVAIAGANRVEWVTTELAIMAAGGAPAPIYTTNTPDQMAYIVNNAKTKIAVCDGREIYDKYCQAIDAGQMDVDWIVTMDDLGLEDPRVITYAALAARGRDGDDAALDARIDGLDPGETGLLIYTSGTTGKPKGVMFDHGAMVAVGQALLERADAIGRGDVPFRAISYLPLCHGAEQIVTTMGLMATGGEVHFCPEISQIRDYLLEVRPTVFLGVPRVWEKFQAALSARFAEATGLKAALLGWARRVELDALHTQARTGVRVNSVARRLANKLALHKVRAAVGFDNMYLAVTGSAPVSTGTLEFFGSLGVLVNEAYGMSETTGVCTLGDLQKPRLGKVGRALSGVEIRIAADGEVQLRGPTMTRGYLDLPEETAALFTDDGWLCTGDLGALDDEGFLSITGRKKELLITAGGKNVAPVELEHMIERIHGVDKAVVVGDRQPYLCALITVDVEALPELAKTYGVAATTEALAACDAFIAAIDAQIASDVNAKLARYQTIKKFRVLPTEFTIEAGELTPTAKIRRNEITANYATEISAFYDTALAK